MSKVSWLISDENVTVNYNGQTHIVRRSDKLSNDLILAIKENRLDDIPNLVSLSKQVETLSKGRFVIKDGVIFVNGVAAPTALGNKILKFHNDELPFEPLVKFAENLQRNPSFRSVNELFQFLELNNHPITENGNFIAYKKVRSDFKDVHSGTFDNSVGNVVEMPRNQVNEDSTVTCSAGLHVANWNYAAGFYAGGLMLEVEVDPADVVAVPTDYNQSKMRVCKYKVLGVVDKENSSDLELRVTTSSNNVYDDDDDDYNDDDCCLECGYLSCDCELD
jgi:hypothetical protein